MFIDAILNGKPIEIHGDGLQTRSFTYVDDLVAGTILAMENDKADGEIFNLGDTREMTIIQLSEIIWKLMKGEGSAPLNFIPYSTFFGGKYEDVRRRIPDITKAERVLRFAPSMQLEAGLKIAIDWQTRIWKAETVESSVSAGN